MSSPKYKQYLLDTLSELEQVLKKFEEISAEYPSVTIRKDEWVYSMSICVDKYREKSDLFKKDMIKFSELIPKERRKKAK
jgi:hypothetical protein